MPLDYLELFPTDNTRPSTYASNRGSLPGKKQIDYDLRKVDQARPIVCGCRRRCLTSRKCSSKSLICDSSYVYATSSMAILRQTTPANEARTAICVVSEHTHTHETQKGCSNTIRSNENKRKKRECTQKTRSMNKHQEKVRFDSR